MSEPSTSRLWIMRAAFAGLVLVILFFHLLPLQTKISGFAPPDMLMAFAFAWSVRRPEFVPALLLAGAFLLADLLLQRPPGLWALLTLLACENLKARARNIRDSTLAVEFLTVTFLIIGVFALYRIVLIILLIPTPPLGLSAMELVLTILFYPLVVLVTHALMGVRKTTPGDLNTAGGRA